MTREKLIFAILVVLLLASFVYGANDFRVIRASADQRGGASRIFIPDDTFGEYTVNCSTDVGMVDVVFVIDTSGSMSDCIDELYMNIGEFAYNIAAIGYDAMFGVVTYCESENYPHGYDLVDASTFEGIVDGLSGAEGGYEETSESMLAAIENMHWRPGAQSVIVFMTDECDDAYPGTGVLNTDLIDAALADSVMIFGYFDCVYSSMEPNYDSLNYNIYCDTTGGQGFEFSTDISDVLDIIVDAIAEFVTIDIWIENTTGAPLDITVEVDPEECIEVADSSDTIQTATIPAEATHHFRWWINEVEGCSGYGECFFIRMWTATERDSVVGCLFVENCGCPGPVATVIHPVCGVLTACEYQHIIVKIESWLPVDPASIRLNINGTNYSLSDEGMSYDPATRLLRYDPPTPWPNDFEVQFYVSQAWDVTGCNLRYSQHCSFHTDQEPPVVEDWGFSPACGSTIEDTDSIRFHAYAHDEIAGMTIFDNLDTLATIEELMAIFTSMYMTINGGVIPGGGVPGIGAEFVFMHNSISWPIECVIDTPIVMPPTPGVPFENFYIIRTACNDVLDLLGLCPGCPEHDWYLNFAEEAGAIRALVGDPASLEICFHFQDLVSSDYCGPNDTVLCCTYYFEGGCVPAVAEIVCPYPCGEYSSCEEQEMIFSIRDTAGVNIDTSRVYFTVQVTNPFTGADSTFQLHPPSPYISFSGGGTSYTVTVSMPYTDADSVTITLDSLYNEDGCLTIPR